MYRNKVIAVVVPAYNEQKLIGKVLNTMPKYVDKIIVVDDCSKDRTLQVLKKIKRTIGSRLVIIRHRKNKGVGGSIVTGYKKAIELSVDAVGVMAGDAQMDPKDLKNLLDAVVDDKCDYAKGNRLLRHDTKTAMPQLRYMGNSILTILNKISTGYWKIMDPQCGYTVASRNALETIPLNEIYTRYGMPNDMLAILNVYNMRVKDVGVDVVYKNEKSGIRLYSFVPKVSWLLFRRFMWRLKTKYLRRDFHPLALFYLFGMMLIPIGLISSFLLVYLRIIGTTASISVNTVILCVFLLIMGFQFLFFGMLFDMEYNRELNP